MLNKQQFSDIKIETPFLNQSCLKLFMYKHKNLFLSTEELDKFELIMSKKGNCSTNDAGTRIANGNVFDSHSLPFYLYNFSALQVIDHLIQNKESCSVLELGCNNGHVPRIFQRNGFKFKEYWGADFDFSFIVDGLDSFTEKDNLFQCNFCSSDFNKLLNFKDDYFGLVYFQEAFDHCRDKFFYAEQCIYEIKRVLKHKGIAYISLVLEHEYRDLYHWDHNYIWEKIQFENMIKDYFEIVDKVPLLTFEQTLNNSCDYKVADAYRHWPKKFAKMVCAHFVDQRDVAVMGYYLRKV
jgi:SAM-dependent methyltransferase